MEEKVRPNSFTRFRFISNPTISEDGDKVAFVVKSANEEGDGYNSNIWLHTLSTGETFQLTRSNEDKSFVWLNGDEIMFTSSRDRDEETDTEETDFFSILVDGGEAKKEFTLEGSVSKFLWHEGRLIFKSLTSIDEDKNSGGDEQDETSKVGSATYQVLDEIPFWGNGVGFTNKKREHIFLYDPEEGERVELTEGAIDVGEFALSDSRIAFIGTRYEDKLSVTNEVYTLNLTEEEPCPSKVTSSEGQFGLVEFFDEKDLFLTFTDMTSRGINENHKLYRYSLDKDEMNLLSEDWKGCIHNSVLTDVRLGSGQLSKSSGGSVYFITTEGSHSRLVSVDRTGDITYETNAEGSVDSFDVNRGKSVFVGLKRDELQELYLTGDDGPHRLTDLNEESLSGLPRGKLEGFTLGDDSDNVQAWVLTPPDFDENLQYPTILEVHGGPEAVYSDVYFHEMQLLANEGYVVLFSNPRGSAGRGDEFADIRGGYGEKDYEGLMKVVDKAIEEHTFINPEKLGVTGGSYGGFMTNWIIGHTNRFDAAVSCRSISNWVSKFNTTDIGYYFVADQQDGDPWKEHDKLWSQSPLRYANQVNTPTLFIHSNEDYRCWMAEGLQMFTALKYFGVDARTVLFEGEDHDLSRTGTPASRIKRLEEMVDWFDKYLK
ncbi:S9 family peptidase [Candidatus Bipolaricaulota bacterium]|nr:S9 family peptidase [Candidatus Bipolaricaulota bacterium]